MRVGLVCPYSWDVPGGVQAHVRDLAEDADRASGHQVSVLAPADEDTPLPPYVVGAGRAVPVRYNGSVARVQFGPVSADPGAALAARRRVRRPAHPRAGRAQPLVAGLWAAHGPIVATFHTSTARSRSLSAACRVLQPFLEKISGRIAVSASAPGRSRSSTSAATRS